MTDGFGPLAKQVREGHNYTQLDVARLLGIDDSRLSRLESGEQQVSLKDYMGFAVLFSTEFSIKTSEKMAELKADIYARLCDLVEAERNDPNPKSFNRRSNLNALKGDLELLHG